MNICGQTAERSRAQVDTITEDEEGAFEALASGFSSIAANEKGPTRFAPTAFDASVKRRSVVPLLWQHDTTAPIGTAELRVVPDHGLMARCKLALSLQKAREARELVRLGSINSVSIGFDPHPSSITMTSETFNGQRVRLIGEASVVEVSMVTFGADPAAKVVWMHRALAGFGEHWGYERTTLPNASGGEAEYRMIRALQLSKR